MKNLLTILFLAISFSCFSQNQYVDFKINEEGNVVWQVVFETDLKFDQICKNVEDKGYFQYDIRENYILGSVNNYILKFFGKSRMSVPFVISLYDYSFDYRLDYKDGKYRVTAKNFRLTMTEDNPIYGKAGTSETLEFYFVKGKKNEFRQNIADIAEYIDKNLEQIFTFTQQCTDDNW